MRRIMSTIIGSPVFLGLVMIGFAFSPVIAQTSIIPALESLPPEVAKVLQDSILPGIGPIQVVDLDLDGQEEILLLTQGPVVPAGEQAYSQEFFYQSIFFLFAPQTSSQQAFPYRLAAMKTINGTQPGQCHYTVQNMGGDPRPEIVWLQDGPDPQGRYAQATIYSYQPNYAPHLLEKAQLTSSQGWVRIHDLDNNGESEILAFVRHGDETICFDVLFAVGDNWVTLSSHIQNMGFTDIQSFQANQGLKPDGRVTHDLLKAARQLSPQ